VNSTHFFLLHSSFTFSTRNWSTPPTTLPLFFLQHSFESKGKKKYLHSRQFWSQSLSSSCTWKYIKVSLFVRVRKLRHSAIKWSLASWKYKKETILSSHFNI
jgi:hypothetical protein